MQEMGMETLIRSKSSTCAYSVTGLKDFLGDAPGKTGALFFFR
jgi:hypothetical protein